MKLRHHLAGMLACVSLLLAAPVVHADDNGSRLSSAGQAWDQWRSEGTRGLVDAAGQQSGRNRADPDAAATASAINRRVGGIAAQVAKGLGAASAAANSDEAARQLAALAEEFGRRGMTGSQRAVNDLRRAMESAGLIDPQDGDSEPRVPDGNPGVPSSCEGNGACARCYAAAIEHLDNTRWRLERLRAIYSSTYRYGKNMMSLADGVSAVHGVAALAWQTRKIEVLKSLKNLDKAYDAKYEELIRQLHTDLQEYSRCEDTVMRVPDWFDRFGFIYYQFMKDHYKRPSL